MTSRCLWRSEPHDWKITLNLVNGVGRHSRSLNIISLLGERGSWTRYACPSRRRRLNIGASEIGSPVRAGGANRCPFVTQRQGQAALAVWPKTSSRSFAKLTIHAYKVLCCSAATRCRTRNSLIRRTYFCHSRYDIRDVPKR